MSSQLRVAVIGAGFWSVANHIPVLKSRDDVKLVSLCDTMDRVHALGAAFGFEQTTKSVDEALSYKIDAAVIATPNDLHFSHALSAIETGAHVLVEKPLATTGRDAWALHRASEKRALHGLVPFGWNFKPFILRAREHMMSGAIGDVESFTCQMASPTIDLFEGRGGYGVVEVAGEKYEAAPSTWSTRERGGGYAFGQLTHALGMLFNLVPHSATSVFAKSRSSSTGVDVADAAVVSLENGVIGTIAGNGTLPDGARFQLDLRIFGTNGVLLVDVERERCTLLRRDGSVVNDEIAPGMGEYSAADAVHAFVDISLGAERENPGSLLIGARGASVVEAIHASSRSGSEVSVANS